MLADKRMETREKLSLFQPTENLPPSLQTSTRPENLFAPSTVSKATGFFPLRLFLTELAANHAASARHFEEPMLASVPS